MRPPCWSARRLRRRRGRGDPGGGGVLREPAPAAATFSSIESVAPRSARSTRSLSEHDLDLHGTTLLCDSGSSARPPPSRVNLPAPTRSPRPASGAPCPSAAAWAGPGRPGSGGRPIVSAKPCSTHRLRISARAGWTGIQRTTFVLVPRLLYERATTISPRGNPKLCQQAGDDDLLPRPRPRTALQLLSARPAMERPESRSGAREGTLRRWTLGRSSS